MRRIVSGLAAVAAALSGLLAAVLVSATPAAAHPHVWVTTRAELVFDATGRVSGIRHAWTFDQGYSAYATQGMMVGDKLDPAKAAELAKLNVDSLADSGFFTTLRASGARQAYGDPQDARVSLDRDGLLVLSFLLPLRSPVATKRVLFDVSDPTFFVDFEVADGDAVTLSGAPAGCAAEINRPKMVPQPDGQKLSEAFFEALSASSTYGTQFANKVVVTCP